MTIDYAPEIGKRFVTVLEEWLTPAEFEQVRTLNDSRQPGICHSHDFCDANMAMEQAFVDVFGSYQGLHQPGWEALWGRAWDWAIEHYLSHSPAAVALEAAGWPEA